MWPGDVDAAVSDVESSMAKHCSVKQMSVSIPRRVLDRLGVNITLNDPSCVGEVMGDAVVLSSHSTQCGSTAINYGSSPMYRNNLVLHFYKGVLEGREAKCVIFLLPFFYRSLSL